MARRAQHPVLLGSDPLPSGSCLVPPVCWPCFPISCQAALPLPQGRSCSPLPRGGGGVVLRKRGMALTLAHPKVDPAPPPGMLSSVPDPESVGHIHCDSASANYTGFRASTSSRLTGDQVTYSGPTSDSWGKHIPHPLSETEMFRCGEVPVPKDLQGEPTQSPCSWRPSGRSMACRPLLSHAWILLWGLATLRV